MFVHPTVYMQAAAVTRVDRVCRAVGACQRDRRRRRPRVIRRKTYAALCSFSRNVA